MPSCCCLNDMGNKMLFRINISPQHTTNAELEGAWPPSSSNLTSMNVFLWGHIKALIYTSPVDSETVPIAHIVEAAATWHSGGTRFCRLCIDVVGRTFEHLLKTGTKHNFFFFRIIRWFCLISNLSQTQFDGPQRSKDASRTYHSRDAIAAQLKYCHLKLIPQLSSTIWQLHPTLLAHLLDAK
jgi:hypothetical protein